MRADGATASPTFFFWAGILLVAAMVSSTLRSLTWMATWAPNAPATWRRTVLAELPEAKMTDLARLTTIHVRRSSFVAAAKPPTMSWAAFFRSPWAKSFQSSA